MPKGSYLHDSTRLIDNPAKVEVRDSVSCEAPSVLSSFRTNRARAVLKTQKTLSGTLFRL